MMMMTMVVKENDEKKEDVSYGNMMMMMVMMMIVCRIGVNPYNRVVIFFINTTFQEEEHNILGSHTFYICEP